MATRIGRREFLAGTTGAMLAATLPAPAIAQNKPVRIGLLTVKTGPLRATIRREHQEPHRWNTLQPRSY